MDLGRTVRRTASVASLVAGAGLATAAPGFANHQTVTGLTTEDPSRIVQFAVGSPGTVTGPTAITGLTAAGDNLIGIDYRPRGGALYAQADNGQLYVIAPPSGAVTTFTATPLDIATDPADADAGFDFNPVPDRLRVNNTADENFRINVDTGATIADGPIAFAATDQNAGDDPAIGGAAYANNTDGATATTLFGLEAGNDALVRQDPPNAGTLNTVGTLPGGDITSVAGFDIETQTGNAYAALQTAGATSSILYRLDLAAGAALSAFGPIGGGALIEGVSLRPIPVLQFANVVTSVAEGDTATVTVNRQGPLDQAATVNYATEVASGDAVTADDFTATSGTLTFAAGDAQETFSVATGEDTANEADESLTVRLSSPSTTANLPAPQTSKVTVIDDDDAPVPPAPPAVPGKPGAAPIGLISVPLQRIDRSLRARFTCDESCSANVTLSSGGRRYDRRIVTQSGVTVQAVNFRLSAREVRRLKRAAKGSRTAKLEVAGTFTDADGSTTSRVVFRLG